VRATSLVGWRLPSLIIILALAGGAVRADGLDEGKSGAELFKTICADCHRSLRGLAKG